MCRLRARCSQSTDVTFQIVQAETESVAALTVRQACRVLGVSRSGFYAWSVRGPSKREMYDRVLKERIRYFHDRSYGTYGARRIHLDLRDDGHLIGHGRVERLMREMQISGRQVRLKRRIHQLAAEGLHAVDLVNRDWNPKSPNEVWLADITQVSTWEGPLYIAVVMDAFSRRIVGWSMENHMRADLVVNAFEMALKRRRPQPGLTHHSDHGSQYTSYSFGKTLREAGVLPSMGRVRTCYDCEDNG